MRGLIRTHRRDESDLPWEDNRRVVDEALQRKGGWPPTRHRIKTRWTNWGRSVINTVTTADLVAECTPSGPVSKKTQEPHGLSMLSRIRSGFSGRTSSSWHHQMSRAKIEQEVTQLQQRVMEMRRMEEVIRLERENKQLREMVVRMETAQTNQYLRHMLTPPNPFLPVIPAPPTPQRVMGLKPDLYLMDRQEQDRVRATPGTPGSSTLRRRSDADT